MPVQDTTAYGPVDVCSAFTSPSTVILQEMVVPESSAWAVKEKGSGAAFRLLGSHVAARQRHVGDVSGGSAVPCD